MHPQLAVIADELAAASARAKRLIDALDEARFHARRDATRWSPAECVAHLTLTTQAYLPLLDAALARGAMAARVPRYRRDLPGWLLSTTLEPPVRFRMKTLAAFVPASTGSRAEVSADFARGQAELVRRLEKASGLDLNQLKIVSPFSSRLSYNVYSAFRILAAHERRHLWQAEQARQHTT
ncbi:MAG TPA: DinB family protein [Gemmatimonadales bacterium]